MKLSRRSLFRLLGVGAAGAALARFLPTAEATPMAPTKEEWTRALLGTVECCAVYLHRDHGALACGERAGHAGPHRAAFAAPPSRGHYLDGGSLGRGSGQAYGFVSWYSDADFWREARRS